MAAMIPTFVIRTTVHRSCGSGASAQQLTDSCADHGSSDVTGRDSGPHAKGRPAPGGAGLLVEVPGIEPGSCSGLPGLLRAQLTMPLLGPTDHVSELV